MYRRALSVLGGGGVAYTVASVKRFLTIEAGSRDAITSHLVALKEECKGQRLDLADMNDAAKDAGRAVQEKVRQLNIDDAEFKGKVTSLSASVKAYHTRLANLQNEAQSIQTEVDALLKVLWGTESIQAASFSSPPSFKAEKGMNIAEKVQEAQDGFSVEPPPIAKLVEDMNQSVPRETKVEQVEGEHLSGGAPVKPASTGINAEEIEVETIEIEVEPSEETKGSSDAAENAVDKMKITDITSDLYERGINFSDCLDAKSLRQRYKDVLQGKFASSVPRAAAQQNTQQPPMPKKPDTQQYQQYNAPPNTNQTGLAQDPYPNAQRKMVDPMRLVEDVKKELCAEQGVDPSSVDLWCGKVRLEDKKRFYDYPTVQSYPIEVRQKGDIPR